MAYCESKLANTLFVVELNKRLSKHEGSTHITTNSVHPGVIDSGINRESDALSRGISSAVLFFFGKTQRQGAQTTVWAAITSVLCGRGGLYLVDCRVAKPGKEVTVENAAKLWTVSCTELGIPEEW